MKIFYGWVIVGVGIVVTCVGFGAMVIAQRLPPAHGRGDGLVAHGNRDGGAAELPLHGRRRVHVGRALRPRTARAPSSSAAASLLGLGMVLASRATTLLQFQLLFGAIVGVASGSFYAPLTASTTKWFTRNRSLAVALVSAGLSVGSTVMAPLARWLITSYDWRTAMLVIGDLVWLVIIPAAFLVRNPPTPAGGRRAGGRGRPARSSRSGRSCARRSSPPSRSRTSRAARRTPGRSSTWSPTRSTAGCRPWPRPPC